MLTTNDLNGRLVKSDLLTYVYPVGAIYESTSNTSPQSFLGGTWTKIEDYELVAYAVTDGNNGQTIVKSKNISSVSLLYTGTYKVTLSKQMADVNYIVLTSAEVGGLGNEVMGTYQHNKGDFLIDITTHDGNPVNASQWYITVFGKLATPEKYRWKRTA